MTSLAALPFDVLDQILSSVFDFSSLKAFTQTCSTLRRCYAAHPNSILESVAINLFGSRALVNAAWRLLLVDRRLDEDSPAFQCDAEWIESQLRLVASSEVGGITWSEARALDECARICAEIEIIYSSDHKDKLTAETSRLSADESEVFRMALLRIWYFLSIINSGKSARAAFEGFETRNEIFYSRLSNQELYELQLVVLWLGRKMDAVDIAAAPFAGLATIGLKGFLEAYMSDDLDSLPELARFVLDWMIEDDFDALCHDRKVNPLGVGESPVSKDFKPLLSSRVGLDDACTKCNAVLGLNLYNCQNWVTKRVLQFENTRDLKNYFPGSLSCNVYERQMFWNYVENPLSDCSTSALPGSVTGPSTTAIAKPIAKFEILNALFHLDTIVTSEKLQKLLAQDGYADIEPDDWLCYPCLTSLIHSRLWIWWHNEKVSGRVIGSVLREDCWYGNGCQAQTGHDSQHALEFNHLCLNTNAEQELAVKWANGYTLPPISM